MKCKEWMNCMTMQEYEHHMKTERELLNYLRLLKASLEHYHIITVADTGAAPYFTLECAQAKLDLGLKVNIIERCPYLQIPTN